MFWASHQERTRGLLRRLKSASGSVSAGSEGDWENALFPESAVALRRSLFNWARIQLVGQILIVVVSLTFGLWLAPIVITLAPFYGGGLQWLCNNTQHTGLQDRVPDYRLCCRTILLNPFVRFLYWQMNYHTEHHMYAAVPCYNLGKLHEQVKVRPPVLPSRPGCQLEAGHRNSAKTEGGSGVSIRGRSAGPPNDLEPDLDKVTRPKHIPVGV